MRGHINPPQGEIDAPAIPQEGRRVAIDAIHAVKAESPLSAHDEDITAFKAKGDGGCAANAEPASITQRYGYDRCGECLFVRS